MDPKGKGMVINDKEKETLYVDEPKGNKPTDSGSSHKKRDGKKKRRIKKTNGSPREQVDLDDVDEDEVPTAAMRTMAIGDVRSQEQQEQD
jgi:hypothetical protein